MKIEVLMSCMKQKNFDLIEKMNLTTDILIINQTNENKYDERIINGKKQRMISNTQKGLSKSRNELLLNMRGDIGIICDDDVIYEKNYEKNILEAFQKLKDADIIVFNIKRINSKVLHREAIKEIKRAPRHRNYSSVQIAFKKESFYKNNLFFNINFGAGSKYSSGEESLLLRLANKKKLNIYEYPVTIATVNDEFSSWFDGYNEKFFYDKGAWLKEAYPKTYFIFMWYFVLKFFRKCDLKLFQIIKYLYYGIKNYKKCLSYEEFLKG